MADFEVKDIRTIGILGANGSGKTTLADSLMYVAGANTRQGNVDQGTSLSDTDEEEKSRKISIRTTSLNCQFGGKNIFLLDTPGYADFWGEVIVAMEVVDSVVIVVDGVTGVDVGTRRIWEAVRKRKLPVAFFITKLDKEHSSFATALESLERSFGVSPIPFYLPNADYPEFSSVLSLLGGAGPDLLVVNTGAIRTVTDKSLLPDVANGVGLTTLDFAEGLRSRIENYREKMVEAAAETDDRLIEKYLESGELSPEEISTGLRKSFSQGSVIPVFAGAALSGVGVKEFLQNVADVFPSPEDRGEMKVGEKSLAPSTGAPFCARVFKSITDPFVGQLSYLRIWSGRLDADSEVYNATSNTREKIGHLYHIRGKEQINIERGIPGYVVAVAKLKNTATGDTLCATGDDYQFPPIRFPLPTAMLAVYPAARGDEEKLSEAFHKFTEEDPTLTAKRDPMTKEFVLSGLGDVHLQVAIARLKNNFNVDVELREPKVAYKETIKSKGETKYRHKKQTGGAGQFAEVWMHVQPYTEGAEGEEKKKKKQLIELPWGGKLLFVDEVVGGHISAQLVQSVKKGYLAAMQSGVLAGYPVVNVIATVYDGKTHPVDSKDIAFQIAGRQGFKEAARLAQPVLLEPIMDATITVPTEYMGTITGDLNSRRGQVLGMNPKGEYQIIRAQVPMAELLKYSSELRSLTGGTGEFAMELDHYDEVPAHIAPRIIEQKKEEE